MKTAEGVNKQISSCRRAAGAITDSMKVEDASVRGSTSTAPITTSTTTKVHKLPRINPPKFSGDIRDYARFKGDFERIVEKEYDDEVHQVYVMKESCLSGDALHLVKNLQTLDEIWERLSERYGSVIDVVDSVLSDLDSVQVPHRFNKHQGVIKLIDTVERGVQDLTAISRRNEIANEYTVKLIEKKLPSMIYREWVDEEDREAKAGGRRDRFESMLEFLKRERRKSEKIVQQSKERDKDKEVDNKKDENKDRKDRQKVYHQGAGKSSSKGDCIIHKNASSHLTRRCNEFKAMSVEERGQLVKDLQACKLCLSVSHVGKECPFEDKWNPCNENGCLGMHSRLLHNAPALKNMHIHQLQVSTVRSEKNEKRTLLLMQEIIADNGKAFTFWDNGSGISLVSRRYARRNNLKGVKVSYDLVTVNNVVTPQHTMLYDIKITNRNGEVNIIMAYEIEEICEETAFFDSNVTDLFKNVNPDDVKRPRGRVDILIGMDYIKLHPTRSETVGDLALFESAFGSGKLLGGQHFSIQGSDKTNAYAKMVAYGGMRNIRVERPEKCIDFFTAENLGVSVPPRCKNCKNCRECTFEATQLSKNE